MQFEKKLSNFMRLITLKNTSLLKNECNKPKN